MLDCDIASQVTEIKEQRTRLIEFMNDLSCIERVYPSDANFVLVRTDDADALYNALLADGIIVRNRNRMPMCKGCVRITVGTPAENDQLIASLTKYDTQWQQK